MLAIAVEHERLILGGDLQERRLVENRLQFEMFRIDVGFPALPPAIWQGDPGTLECVSTAL